MSFNEVAGRPCLAVCRKCRTHGVIVLADGSHSDPVGSVEDGKRILADLVSAGRITQSDSDRVEDHLNASDIPTRGELLLVVVGMVTLGLSEPGVDDEIHEHTCSKCGNTWQHGSRHEDGIMAHTCSKCGELQFGRG